MAWCLPCLTHLKKKYFDSRPNTHHFPDKPIFYQHFPPFLNSELLSTIHREFGLILKSTLKYHYALKRPFTSQHWLWNQGTFLLDLDHSSMLDLWAKPMKFSKAPTSPLSQRSNNESLLENELADLCRGASTVSLPHGNVCCLASIFKRSEACSCCSEMRCTPIQSPTDLPHCKTDLFGNQHTCRCLVNRGLSSARSRSCSFSKTSPARLDAAYSRLSRVWSNQK